jgi:hypothetical protein
VYVPLLTEMEKSADNVTTCGDGLSEFSENEKEININTSNKYFKILYKTKHTRT